MTKKSSTPAIRFKGFTDTWEQRKLGELCNITTGKLDANAMVSDGQYDFYTSGIDVFKIDVAAFEGPAITIAGNGASVGYMHLADGKFNAYQRTYVLTDFLADRQFLNVAIGNELPNKIQEEVRGSGIPYIVLNMLTDLAIPFPSHEEQYAIGVYFQQLDNLITLHQRKYDKLTNVKKSMLEKMFPKNGSNVPEIRFKGFTEAWEQRKLGDIADIVGGGTPSTGNQSYWDGDIDWYAPAEIADQIYANSSQKKITGLGYENSSAKMLPPGTVLFTSRAGIGKTAILTRKGCTNQGFQSIVPHRGELDSYFIFSRTEELKRYGELVGAGSTFVEVSGKQMAVMELMMPPTMREQQTIGGFFQQLDHLITLHQRELEKLKNLKKACLEKMFV